MLSQQVCNDRCGLLSSKKQSQISVTEIHHPSGLQFRLETSLLTLTVFSDWEDLPNQKTLSVSKVMSKSCRNADQSNLGIP